MYIDNFLGGRGSSKYYHGYIEGGWGYKGPKNVLRSMWLIPKTCYNNLAVLSSGHEQLCLFSRPMPKFFYDFYDIHLVKYLLPWLFRHPLHPPDPSAFFRHWWNPSLRSLAAFGIDVFSGHSSKIFFSARYSLVLCLPFSMTAHSLDLTIRLSSSVQGAPGLEDTTDKQTTSSNKFNIVIWFVMWKFTIYKIYNRWE